MFYCGEIWPAGAVVFCGGRSELKVPYFKKVVLFSLPQPLAQTELDLQTVQKENMVKFSLGQQPDLLDLGLLDLAQGRWLYRRTWVATAGKVSFWQSTVRLD